MSKTLNFLTFIVLEVCSVVFLVNDKVSTHFYNKKFFNDIFTSVTYLRNYSSLQKSYEKVLEENCQLREQIINAGIQQVGKKFFRVMEATVVNGRTGLSKNYFTVDKGAKCGIKEGMSIFSAQGFVGIVAKVGNFYSTVIPMIHDNFYFSAYLKNSKATGTIKWDGENIHKTKLMYIPKYIEVVEGEEIFTSGFNSSICPNLLVGTVDHVDDTEKGSFYAITVNIQNDFSALHNVYIMSNELLHERLELEKNTVKQYG